MSSSCTRPNTGHPTNCPDGPALVVGAGNSGLQIAAELAATRPVTIAVGAGHLCSRNASSAAICSGG